MRLIGLRSTMPLNSSIFLGGNIVLILEEDKEIVEVIMNMWHNAYRPNGGLGMALVVERDGIVTKFKKMPRKL